MIKGKQLKDKTLNQDKLNLDTPVNAKDAATKEYVDLNFSAENADASDVNLIANVVTIDGQLATDTGITNQPVVGTYVGVSVNGKLEEIGDIETDAGYFSPDGVFKRTQGAMRQGDKLYWNPSKSFMLDTNDIIEFNYLTNGNFGNVVQLANGDDPPFDNDVQVNMYDLNGPDGTTAAIVIDETDEPVVRILTDVSILANVESYIIQNDNGNLIFDVGNVQGHLTTFTTIGESIEIRVKSNYTVVYDGGDATKQGLTIVKKTLQETMPILEDLVYLSVNMADRKIMESFDATTWTEIDLGGQSYTSSSSSTVAWTRYRNISANFASWYPMRNRTLDKFIVYNKNGNHILYSPGVSSGNLGGTFGNNDASKLFGVYWGGSDVREKPVSGIGTWPKISSGSQYPVANASETCQHIIAGGWTTANVQYSHDYGVNWTIKAIPGFSTQIHSVAISADGQIMLAYSDYNKFAYSIDGALTWNILSSVNAFYNSVNIETVVVISSNSTSAVIYYDSCTNSHTLSGFTKIQAGTSADGSRALIADMLSDGTVDIHYSHDYGRPGTWNQINIPTSYAGGSTIYITYTSPHDYYVYLTGSSNIDDVIILDKDTYEILTVITPPFSSYGLMEIKDWNA